MNLLTASDQRLILPKMNPQRMHTIFSSLPSLVGGSSDPGHLLRNMFGDIFAHRILTLSVPSIRLKLFSDKSRASGTDRSCAHHSPSALYCAKARTPSVNQAEHNQSQCFAETVQAPWFSQAAAQAVPSTLRARK